MQTSEFLGQLKGVTPTGEDAWVACCPAHGDEHPSMSVTEKDGKILVHCHAGCTASDIVASMGLKLADLFTEPRASAGSEPRARQNEPSAPRKKKSGSHGTWICDYLYHDADGNLLYKASRYLGTDGKKNFSIKHRDGSAPGGWAYGLKDAGLPRVVYHLPEVVNAGRSGGTVVIAEGEKDVDNIRALGYCATCNVGGAGKWGYCFPADWGKWFDGVRKILIIADNDPAEKTVQRYDRHARTHVSETKPFLVGQRHAWTVYNLLLAAGYKGQIKLMVMPSVGDAHVKDFTDWIEALAAAGTTDRAEIQAAFQAAVKAAPAWPDEWRFTENDVANSVRAEDERPDVAPAEKGGRDAASPLPEEDDAREGAGRFGRLGPRSPETGARKIEVEFRATEKLSVWLEVVCTNTVQQECIRAGARLYRKSQSGKDISAKTLARLKAWVVASWLLSRGEFFWDVNQNDFASCMFIDYGGAENRLMRISSDEFLAFVADAAGFDDVDATRGDLKMVMGLVKQIAVHPDYAKGVAPSTMWDRRGDAVYISSGDGWMYRLKDGTVARVKNGADGVVFLRRRTLEPWSLCDGPGVDPFEKALVFDGANWGDAFGRMNIRLWVLNLFACHTTKPILLISGLAQSGKTRMAKAVKELLGVRLETGGIDRSVQQIERGDKGQEAFWVTINDGKLEVFDNFDTKVDWAGDALQNAATDGQTKRRTLYKTAGVTVLQANASLILTSNHPMFLSEGGGGMADRVIDIPLLSKVREKSLDGELTRDILERRDQYLTWIARTVATALADKDPVEDGVNKRHPDYGTFSIRCARAFGDVAGAVAAMGSAEGAKAILPLKQDGVASAIIEALRERGWIWDRFYSGDMAEAIVATMAGDEDAEALKKKFPPVVVGKVLGKFERQFATIFKLHTAKGSGGRKVYSVAGLTDFGVSQVGEVELKGDSAKTPTGAEKNNFTRADGLSLPTLRGDPHARAPAPTLFHENEKEEKGTEDQFEDMEGGPDDGLDF